MFGPKQEKAAPSIWSFDSGYISSEPQVDDAAALQIDQDPLSEPTVGSHSASNSPFIEDSNGYFKYPNFWNVHVGDEHVRLQRDQIQVAPLVTKLNVFTSRDCSRTNSIFVARGKDANEDRECVACELWAITNPGEGILCDKCKPLEPVHGIAPSEIAKPTLANDNGCSSMSLTSLLPTRRPSGLRTEAYHATSKCGSTWLAKHPTTRSPLKAKSEALFKDQRCSACELSALVSPNQPTKCASCIEALAESHPEETKMGKVTRSRARRGFKLPLNALTKLQAWLDANQHDPYPSAEVKKQLAQQCGITEKQVTTWFTNARARQLNSTETVLSSNSDDDASSESEGYDSHYIRERRDRASDQKKSRSAGNDSRPVQPGIDTSCSRAGSVSGSSAYNSFSPLSSTRGPLGPAPSRRGKKKNYRKHNQTTDQTVSTPSHAPPYPPGIVQSSPVSKQANQDNWQCTFCLKTLTPKSWRRHEETQHLPRSRWSCMLFGPRLSFSRGSTSSCCAFCMEKDPSDEHIHSSHRISECSARPLQDRTFYRPDHLRQHVKNYHNSTLFDIAAAKWKTSAEESRNGDWMCGFCASSLPDWNSREVHIAGHFRDGMTMDQWSLPITRDHDEQQVPNHQNIETRGPIASTLTPIAHSFSAIATSASRGVSFAPPMPLITSESLDSIMFRTCGNMIDNPMTVPAPSDGFQGTFSDLDPWPDLSTTVLPSLADDSMMYEFNDFMPEHPPWNIGL